MLMFVYHKLCKVISNRFYILVTTLQGYKRHVENQAASLMRKLHFGEVPPVFKGTCLERAELRSEPDKFIYPPKPALHTPGCLHRFFLCIQIMPAAAELSKHS